MDWLKPFMTRSQCKKGDVLFAKDAIADAMYYTVSGRYRLTELGIEIGPGQLIGELGMLAPSNRRTASFECIEDGILLSVTYSQVEELVLSNPSFGFCFLRISTARLFDNIARLEARLAQQTAAMRRNTDPAARPHIRQQCKNPVPIARRGVGSECLLRSRRIHRGFADVEDPPHLPHW